MVITRFKNRAEAGSRLAARLAHLANRPDVLVCRERGEARGYLPARRRPSLIAATKPLLALAARTLAFWAGLSWRMSPR